MNKNLLLKQLLSLIFLTFSVPSVCQVTGDFQTKVSTGNWSNFNSWNVYNGSAWVATVPGQLPTPTANVYVQANHIISVDNSSAVCNNITMDNATGGKVAFTAVTSMLNVKGNFAFLTNSTTNCFGTWISGGKIVFSGNGTQTLPNNLGTNSVLDHIEVNKSSGTLTTGNSIKFNTFNLTAGNFDVASAADIRGNSGSASININGGIWTQILGTTTISSSSSSIGPLTINGGSMVLETSTSIVGFQLSTINITNGGTLTLNPSTVLINISNSINVSAGSFFNTALSTTPFPTTVNLTGIVNYNRAGNQLVFAAPYAYLKLSGNGIKTLSTGTTTIPNNATLEMSGVATSPTLSLGAGTLSVSSTGSNLIYSSTGSQAASASEWDPNFQNITINNTSSTGVSMAGLGRTISGSLNLNNGNFDIGASGSLTLNGASLNRINGFLKATSTSDLTVTGTTGGIVLLPLSTNISLRDITISGTRTLAMDGISNIDLYGTLNIGATATYDNGGESQLQKGASATPYIIVDGKFLSRDKDNFTGNNGAIPGIAPVLNSACTIEYGLNGNQVVTARTDYRNIIFSGSGMKTPSSTFTPNGMLKITNTAILDASNHNISDGSTATNFTMDGGRIILGTTTPTTQPQINGLYNLTGGVVEFAGSNSSTQAIRSLKNYYAIEVTGTNVGNSSGNISLSPNGSFTIKTNGIFMINADAIVGTNATESVTVENGAIFKCGNNEGFNGFVSTLTNFSSIHQNIRLINLMPGSTVEYIRAGDQPITNFNGLVYQNLLLSGSGNKLAPAGTFSIKGNLTKAGTSIFVPGGGTVLLNGTGTQSFAGLTYNNLVLTNNTKTTQGSSTILDSLKVNASTILNVTAADTIVIRSDAGKTARVGQVDGSITNTSRFTVERFIPLRRAWRFLSVPTSSLQTIKDAWQEGALTLSSNPNPGYGIQIQSNAANWMSTGFDAQSINGPSIKTYDYLTDTYTPVASLLNPFNASLGGYMTFIRGDRTASYFGAPVTKTILRTTGNLFTGNQPVINVKSGRIIPVNNPYASPLDLRKLSSSYNIFYYVWDPNRGGNFGLGAFQTFSWNGSGYDVIPGSSGSYLMTNNFIESGQAFFVSTLGLDTTIQITENAKVSTTPAIIPFVPASNPMQLRLNLYMVNIDGTTVLSDGTLTSFANNYNDQIDGMDAKKLVNIAENLSIKSHNEFLTIERKPLLNTDDTIFLNLTRTQLNQYRFELIADNLDQPNLEAYLEDAYLNKRDRLNLNGTTHADFAVDANVGSGSAERFRIVFEAHEAGPLPVSLTNVKAYKKYENISVEWTAYNESGVVQYDIEKSAEGNSFDYVATHIANNTPYKVYVWLDGNAFAGYNYYRIKIIYATGEITYSKIVKVLMPERISSINVYPNPVKDGTINLRFANQPGGIYQFKLVNKIGQIILIKEISHATGNAIEKIAIENKKLAHGIYNLEIIRPDASKITRKILY